MPLFYIKLYEREFFSCLRGRGLVPRIAFSGALSLRLVQYVYKYMVCDALTEVTVLLTESRPTNRPILRKMNGAMFPFIKSSILQTILIVDAVLSGGNVGLEIFLYSKKNFLDSDEIESRSGLISQFVDCQFYIITNRAQRHRDKIDIML